jgi:hypothetical protein
VETFTLINGNNLEGKTMTYSEWQQQNTDYVLLDDNGDIHAEVSLPNTYTLDSREGIMGTMAAATRTRWSEATDYNFEG